MSKGCVIVLVEAQHFDRRDNLLLRKISSLVVKCSRVWMQCRNKKNTDPLTVRRICLYYNNFSINTSSWFKSQQYLQTFTVYCSSEFKAIDSKKREKHDTVGACLELGFQQIDMVCIEDLKHNHLFRSI